MGGLSDHLRHYVVGHHRRPTVGGVSDDKVAKRLQRFHLARLAVWSVQVPIALLTDLKNSTPYIVFLSLAALVEGSGAAYMASRAERS